MDNLHTYLPQDRLRALARGETLPDRTTGTVLFADISGFTPLTESLRTTLGPRRGAEELTRQINAVYDALIAEIERHTGSVINFAGDAITCWFEQAEATQSAPARAIASAHAMQQAMTHFAQLGLKIAIASGAARRFVVGDPAFYQLDTLAGITVARTATAEHLAHKGEVLVDEATLQALGGAASMREWRADADSGERFAVLNPSSFDPHLPASHARPLTPSLHLSHERLRQWILPVVYARETTGQGAFLMEFRPCAVLFVRFSGIDYEADDAQAQLDRFIQQAQGIATRYAGTLLNLTIGDKGSYIYINFGALSAHEDDARRAVKAALALRKQTELRVQMGIAQGVMRVGTYGGATRCTYGALGDEVNLAARLMSTAAPSEILLSRQIHQATAHDFVSEPRAPLQMKGKAEPLPVFVVTSERQHRAIRLQEPTYALPMVGRDKELQIADAKLELTLHDQSQIIGVVAEAGMGKSRLVAEVIRLARKKGFAGYGGVCQSDAIHTAYHPWKAVWQAFFGVDPELSLRKQVRTLAGEIADRAPERVQAMPLLSILLNLEIPDNDFTQTLEPKQRASVLHALLEDCLRAAAQDEPVLIVLEDLHWIDALSYDLLEKLTRALTTSPVCFVIAYRPPQIARIAAPRLETLPNFTAITLHELDGLAATQIIRAKLAQLQSAPQYRAYPAQSGTVPPTLVEKLMARAQGNPFYLEELLNFLRDRGLDPRDPHALNKIELPDSLHTLILSRIDQLSEHQKSTLRVASIIGRLFRADWLSGYSSELGAWETIKADLDELHTLDITPLDTPEPKLTYLFKHIITHEVTYESLSFSTRARLHEQLALYLETAETQNLTSLLDTLTFHYLRSDNPSKQREYLRKAAEAAQKSFANAAALEYYEQLLPVLKADQEKAQIHLKRGQVLELLGKFDEAESDYRAALESAQEVVALKATAQFALGKLNRQRGDFEAALNWLEQAQEARLRLADTVGLAHVLIEMGMVWHRKGEYGQARQPLQAGLALAREAGDTASTALALNNLGNVAYNQGDSSAARALYAESLALKRELGDRQGIAASLNNLGIVALAQGDYAAARTLHEESLALKREMGDKAGIAVSLISLGLVTLAQGEYVAARALYAESLSLRREMGDKWGIALSLISLGLVALAQGDYAAAQALYAESLSLGRAMGDNWGVAVSLVSLGNVALAQGDYAAARALQAESLVLCQEMDDKSNRAYALLSLGRVDLAERKPEARANILGSLRLRQELGDMREQTSSLIGAAGLVLQEGDSHRAAQLLGAVGSALTVLKAVVEPDVKSFYEQTLAQIKEALGAAAFNAAWAVGAQWTLEEAMQKALEEATL